MVVNVTNCRSRLLSLGSSKSAAIFRRRFRSHFRKKNKPGVSGVPEDVRLGEVGIEILKSVF